MELTLYIEQGDITSFTGATGFALNDKGQKVAMCAYLCQVDSSSGNVAFNQTVIKVVLSPTTATLPTYPQTTE